MSLDDYDDQTVLDKFKELPVQKLLNISFASPRCLRLSQEAAKSHRKLILLYGASAKKLPSVSLFQSGLEEEDTEVESLDEVENIDPSLPPLDSVRIDDDATIRIDRLQASITVSYLTGFFANITELIIALNTKPEDLRSVMGFLEALGEKLVSLKIYAFYRTITVPRELRNPTYVHQHDRLLYLINNSMPALKKLTVAIRAHYLRTNYSRFNLPILKQLEEFYFYASGAEDNDAVQLVDTVVRNCLEHGSLKTFNLGIFPEKSWNMNFILEIFRTLGEERRFEDFLQSIRVLHTRIYPSDRWFLGNSMRLKRLTLLNLHITTANISRNQLIESFTTLPAVKDIRIIMSLEHFEHMMSPDMRREASHYIRHPGVLLHPPAHLVVPTVRYFSLNILRGERAVFQSHAILATFHAEHCFPNLACFNLTLPQVEPCAGCFNNGLTLGGWEMLNYDKCLQGMIQTFAFCPRLVNVKVHLNSGCTTYSREELLDFASQ